MPFFDSRDFQERTKITKMQTSRILKYLSDEKIISDNEKIRNKTYFFDDLIKIIK
jgi:hypothetical protein